MWILYALLTAIFASSRDLASKRGSESLDEYIIAWASRFFALPLFAPILLFVPQPEIGDRFAPVFLATITIQIGANLLYFRAVKLADLSLAIPMLSFTPLFLLVTSPILVGEYPTFWDIVGVVLIASGAYLLNIKAKALGYFAPFRALWKQRGTQLMLVVALLWSLLANLNKIGMQNSSPWFWAAIDSAALAPAFTAIAFYKSRASFSQVIPNLKYLFPLGLAQGLTLLCALKGFELTLVARVVAVKRASVLFSALAGHILLHEPGIRERGTGAIVMFVGVAIITLL